MLVPTPPCAALHAEPGARAREISVRTNDFKESEESGNYMKTTTERLREQGQELIEGVAALFGENYQLRDINKGDGTVITMTPYYFNKLTLDQTRLQSKLLDTCRHFFELISALTKRQPEQVKRSLMKHERTVRAVIGTNRVSYRTSDEAVNGVRTAVARTLDELANLYDPTEGEVMLLPDTNALIASPALQDWRFRVFPKFNILLVPTVLSELDAHSYGHRNEDVRRKARKVIRQVKEYRRRGSLADGVDLVAGSTRLFATAVEPRVSDALPWLDATSMDDRILASLVEAVRTHPRSVVALVTGDINLQNKGRLRSASRGRTSQRK